MTRNTPSSPSLAAAPTVARSAAIVLAAAFLALLFLLHFLKPELDPSWRMISEYEIGRYGWLMRLAFFCWGGSVLALVWALGPSLQTTGGRIGRWWLVLIGICMMGAGIFKTKAILDTTNTTASNLRTLCGAVVIMTFPLAASIVARSLARNQRWAPARRWLLWGTLLVWFSLFAYFGSIVVSGIINPAAGRVGPEVFMGWPNRFMVTTYSIWLILVARRATRIT